MIRLIVADMDGTFLNSDGDFNRTLFEDVKQAMETSNVQFALCTGKQCERVEELFGDDAANFWILGDSATRMKYKGEVVYESFLDKTLGLEIIDALEAISKEFIIIVSTADGAVVRADLTDEQVAFVKTSFANVKQVERFRQIEGNMMKLSIYDAKLRSRETREKLRPFFDRAYIVASEPGWIDVAHLHTDKGTVVQKLQAKLRVSYEETMVFGDGMNDVALMGQGLYSFAMRNGCDETKAEANYITRTNDEDAVMHTILHLLRLQQVD